MPRYLWKLVPFIILSILSSVSSSCLIFPIPFSIHSRFPVSERELPVMVFLTLLPLLPSTWWPLLESLRSNFVPVLYTQTVAQSALLTEISKGNTLISFGQLLLEIGLLSRSFMSGQCFLCPLPYFSKSLAFSQFSDSKFLNFLYFSPGLLLPLVCVIPVVSSFASTSQTMITIFEFITGIYNFTVTQIELIFKQLIIW